MRLDVSKRSSLIGWANLTYDGNTTLASYEAVSSHLFVDVPRTEVRTLVILVASIASPS